MIWPRPRSQHTRHRSQCIRHWLGIPVRTRSVPVKLNLAELSYFYFYFYFNTSLEDGFLQSGRAGCLTGAGGPEEFKECRNWFIWHGEIQSTNQQCMNSDPPINKKCHELHNKLPELRNITSVIIAGKKKLKCFPAEKVAGGNRHGWCAVCTGARRGQPGYCDPRQLDLQPYEVDYDDDTPDDVNSNAAWGYCDSKCHVSVSNLQAKVLQEVRVSSIVNSWHLKNTNTWHILNTESATTLSACWRANSFFCEGRTVHSYWEAGSEENKEIHSRQITSTSNGEKICQYKSNILLNFRNRSVRSSELPRRLSNKSR